jgi:hypothetical protein
VTRSSRLHHENQRDAHTRACRRVVGHPKNAVVNLKVSVSLPDKTETTANGVPPAGTIQGLSTSLTWTFTEQRRTATTTTS